MSRKQQIKDLYENCLMADARYFAEKGYELPTEKRDEIKWFHVLDKYDSNYGSLKKKADRNKGNMIVTITGKGAILGVGIGFGVLTGGAGILIFLAGGAATWAVKKKLLRGFRARHFKKKIKKFKAGADLTEVANGIRYWVQKKKLSTLADDLREMHHSLSNFVRVRDSEFKSCHDALELSYWYARCLKIGGKIEQDIEVFRMLYESIIKNLKMILRDDEWAFKTENVKKALEEAHEFVAPYSVKETYKDNRHSNCKTKSNYKKLCYKYSGRKNPKPAHPMVSTTKSLSEFERQPFVRLLNDAAHISLHGENIRRHRYKNYLSGKVIDEHLIPGISVFKAAKKYPYSIIYERQPGVDVFEGDFNITYNRLKIKGDFTEDQKREWENSGFSKANINKFFIEMKKQQQTEQRKSPPVIGIPGPSVKKSALTQGGIETGVGVGTTGATALGKYVFKYSQTGSLTDAGQTAVTSLAHGGIMLGPGVVYGMVEEGVKRQNIKNEIKKLQSELRKGTSEADIERMIISLRTILKNGEMFENIVDEVIKLVTYHKEFKATMEDTDKRCGRAYEIVYRIMKFSKHYNKIITMLPVLKLFGKIAITYHEHIKVMKTDEFKLEVDKIILNWLDKGDHTQCIGKGRCCYAGVPLNGDDNDTLERLGVHVSDDDYEKKVKEIMGIPYS